MSMYRERSPLSEETKEKISKSVKEYQKENRKHVNFCIRDGIAGSATHRQLSSERMKIQRQKRLLKSMEIMCMPIQRCIVRPMSLFFMEPHTQLNKSGPKIEIVHNGSKAKGTM